MGDVTRSFSTAPAPASLRAAGESSGEVVTIVNDGPPVIGQPGSQPSRWQLDWQLVVPACRPVVTGAYGCPMPDEDALKGWDPGGRSVLQGRPFGVESQFECSLPILPEPVDSGDSLEDGLGSFLLDAERALQRGIIPRVAEELYSGAIAREMIDDSADAWEGNRWLTRTDYPVSGFELEVVNDPSSAGDAPSLVGGIGLLEQYLSCCSDLARGVIHVPPSLIGPLASKGQSIQGATTGGARFTGTGNVLVADCGYTGYGPGDVDEGPQEPPDGVMWLYATGPIQVRYTIGTPIGRDFAEVAAAFAEYNNIVTMVPAAAMVTWGCCHAAVAVDVSEFGLTLNPGS